MSDLVQLLGTSLPKDHSRQQSAEQLIKEIMGRETVQNVLDVGCGAGNSADLFVQLQPTIHWVGVDIDSSPEVNQRRRTDCEFHTFDGKNLPFPTNSFDMIFSKQVFEHVRYPAELLLDMARVMRPGGLLVGSTSHLEPFHSYSYWNYTPYGFKILVEQAGLELVEIRPLIDSVTLIMRRLLGEPKYFGRWWSRDSPLNKIFSLRASAKKHDHAKVNATKLTYCGQFSFVCRKP